MISTSLTISLRFGEQQTTWSPGRPMTRLMRWSSDSAGSRPTNTSPSWIAPETPLRSTGGATSSQPPGSWKTTTSPCLRSTGPGVSFETMTRSPTRRVSSIDPEGMKKACSSQVLTTNDSTSAMTTTTTTSRTAAVTIRSGPCGAGRRRATCRPSWAGRPSGSDAPPRSPPAPRPRGRSRGRSRGRLGTGRHRAEPAQRPDAQHDGADDRVARHGGRHGGGEGRRHPAWRSRRRRARSGRRCRRAAGRPRTTSTRPTTPSATGVERSTVAVAVVSTTTRSPASAAGRTFHTRTRSPGSTVGASAAVGTKYDWSTNACTSAVATIAAPRSSDRPGTTRPGLGHGGGRCRVGVWSGGHPAEPSRRRLG